MDSIHKEEQIEVSGQLIIEGDLREKTIIQGSGENNISGSRIFKILPEGNLTLENLIIEKGLVNEHPWTGAGIYNMDTCKIVNCIIQKNIGTYGLGIYSEEDLTIEASIIQMNVSRKRPKAEDAVGFGCAGSGGGLSINGEMIMNNSIGYNNTTHKGGGIHLVGILNLTNSLLANNVPRDLELMLTNQNFSLS